jgi:hypothetical protein
MRLAPYLTSTFAPNNEAMSKGMLSDPLLIGSKDLQSKKRHCVSTARNAPLKTQEAQKTSNEKRGSAFQQ